MNRIFLIVAAVLFAVSSSMEAHAEKIICESRDKSSQFEVKESEPSSGNAAWRIAHFTHAPYRQRSVYTVYQTSRADKVLYVSEGNRKEARLELGIYNEKGEYPDAKLVSFIPGGGYQTTVMSCTLEGKISFVNQCADSRPEILGKKLVQAARDGDIEGVDNLLDCGAKPNFMSKNGCNALLATLDPACTGLADTWRPFPTSNVNELANVLLDRGALTDSQEKRTGETTVHKAVRFGAENDNRDILELLIGLEASINASDKNGKTPLMLAVLKHDLESIQILVEGGADIKLKDKRGKTAFDYANSTEFSEAKNFLVEPSQITTFQGNIQGECTPTSVTAKSGSLVRFVVKATADKMFRFTATQLDIDIMAEPGQTSAKNIRLDKKGEFEFTCGFHGANDSTRGVIKVE
jgi:hypothetical protein